MAGEVTVTVDALKEKAREIAEMDVTLDASAGSKTAGKRAMKNALVSEGNSDFVTSVINSLRENFGDDRETLSGTALLLESQISDEFGDEVDEIVAARVEEQQKAANVDISDEELVALAETRKERVNEFKALKGILEMFGHDVSAIQDPKTRRGSSGPRGPRTLSKFQYKVNETVLEESVNSLSTVAKLSGEGVLVRDLKDFITNQGVDLKNPPAEWSASLPNEVGTLYATVLPEYASEFEDDAAASDEDSEDSDDE